MSLLGQKRTNRRRPKFKFVRCCPKADKISALRRPRQAGPPFQPRSATTQDNANSELPAPKHMPWNKGKLTGANASENSQISPSTIVRAAQGDSSISNLASALQEGRKNANIQASSGVIRGI